MTYKHPKVYKGIFNQNRARQMVEENCLMCEKFMGQEHDFKECFTGSIVVKLYNEGDEEYHFRAGDKIVQMVILPYLAPEIEFSDKLTETARGNSGFGSSGR